MKKNLVFVALLGLVMTTFFGCGGKTVKGTDGKEYDSYQSACRNQDFVAAYDWIEKYHGSEDDKDYVFNAEMLYLTSLGTEEASKRIIYLLAEYQIPGVPIKEEYLGGGVHTTVWYEGERYDESIKYAEGVLRFNQRCDKVLDMALAQENVQLAIKIISLYKRDININYNNKERRRFTLGYPSHSYKSKETAQVKIIPLLINEAKKTGDYSQVDSYLSNVDMKIDNTELISYLSSINTEINSERVLGLLTSLENKIPIKPRIGKFRISDDYYKDHVCDPYSEAVKNYNDACRRILNIAIKNKNKYLSERILPKFKSNINSVKLQDTFEKGMWAQNYNIQIDNSDISSAKAEYQEAVRSGVFK